LLSELQIPPYLVGKVRVTSFVEANEILRNPEFAAGRTEEESLPFRGRTLLELDGDDHRQRRKLETPLFVPAMLERYELEILAPAIARCLAEVDDSRGPDGVVRADLARLSHSMFVQIAAALIGLDAVDTPERTALLERCVFQLSAAFDVKYSTDDHAEVIAAGLAAKDVLIEHFYRPSMQRRADLLARHVSGELGSDDLPTDLLATLLRNYSDDWDADLPVREVILFLSGATATTSNAVNHAVVELRAWLADHDEDQLQLDNPAFLQGVCNEALRLHQNVTALVRRADLDVTLSTGRLIRSGEYVAVDLIAANQDPDAFGADAATFNPWRQVQPAIRPYGLTFGTGRHTCIGLPLVTPPSGKPPGEGEGDRAMLRILRSLLEAGIELDPERPPTYVPTAEDVYASLPVVLTAR
jgi:cytochrome P450